MSPRVSVIVSTCGRPELLGRALRSAQEQTYPDCEIIVVDDNGPGPAQAATARTVEGLAGRFPVHYRVHSENRGNAAARNTGIATASGDYLAFLDDDDRWYPDKLRQQVECLEGTDSALVYCRSVNVGEDGRVYSRERPGGPSGKVFEQLLAGDFIGASSKVLIRRACLEQVGPLDESLPTRPDHDLFLRLARRYPVDLVDEELVEFRIHPDRISRNLQKKEQGWARFLEKWRPELEGRPAVHRRLRFQQAFELGKLCHLRGEHGRALRHLVAAVKSRPASWKAWVLLVSSSLRLRLPLK